MTTLEALPTLIRPSGPSYASLENLEKQPPSSAAKSSFDPSPSTLKPPSAFLSAPELTPPSKIAFNEILYLRAISDIYEAGSELMDSFSTHASFKKEEMKKLSLEHLEKIKEASLRTQDKSFWSFLQKIGECILAALGAVLGFSLISSGAGAVVGSVLVTSSLLSLFNFAMKETGSWNYVAKLLASDTHEQKRIAELIPYAIGMVTGVLSLAGSTAAIWNQLDFAQQGIVLAQATVGAYQSGVSIAKGITEMQSLHTQADLRQIDTKNNIEKISYQTISMHFKQVMQMIHSSQETAEQIIQLSIESRKKATTYT